MHRDSRVSIFKFSHHNLLNNFFLTRHWWNCEEPALPVEHQCDARAEHGRVWRQRQPKEVHQGRNLLQGIQSQWCTSRRHQSGTSLTIHVSQPTSVEDCLAFGPENWPNLFNQFRCPLSALQTFKLYLFTWSLYFSFICTWGAKFLGCECDSHK